MCTTLACPLEADNGEICVQLAGVDSQGTVPDVTSVMTRTQYQPPVQ